VVTGEVISHAAQIQPIWDARCSEACHLGSSANGGLSLNDGFGATVGVPAIGIAGMDLITPGNPDQSYMWLKLNDTHMGAGGIGAIMPTSGMLASTELDLIKSWIDGGAKP